MDKKIIIFNGPPGCGKDTATLATMSLVQAAGVHEKMAMPLKKAVHALYGIFASPEHYDDPKYRHEKDIPIETCLGLSLRQAYISMSEDYLKPKFGQDVIGQMALNKIKKEKSRTVHVFSDGGFAAEWHPIIDHVQPSNVLIVEIKANKRGTVLDFDGDSRGYIGDQLTQRYPDVTVRTVYNDIGNHEDKEMFRMMILSCVRTFLGISTDG